MSDDVKKLIIGCTCTVILGGFLVFGCAKCNNSNNTALTDCIKITNKPLECKQAINR